MVLTATVWYGFSAPASVFVENFGLTLDMDNLHEELQQVFFERCGRHVYFHTPLGKLKSDSELYVYVKLANVCTEHNPEVIAQISLLTPSAWFVDNLKRATLACGFPMNTQMHTFLHAFSD